MVVYFVDLSQLLQRSTSVTSSDGTDYMDSGPTSPTGLQMPTISLTGPAMTEHFLRGRSDSPEGDMTEFHLPLSEDGKPYDTTDVEEILETLKTTESLHEQADIIHYLFVAK